MLIAGCAGWQERFVAGAGGRGGEACVQCRGLHSGPDGAAAAPGPIVYRAEGLGGMRVCWGAGWPGAFSGAASPAARLLGCAQTGMRCPPRMQVRCKV